RDDAAMSRTGEPATPLSGYSVLSCLLLKPVAGEVAPAVPRLPACSSRVAQARFHGSEKFVSSCRLSNMNSGCLQRRNAARAHTFHGPANGDQRKTAGQQKNGDRKSPPPHDCCEQLKFDAHSDDSMNKPARMQSAAYRLLRQTRTTQENRGKAPRVIAW
ncbi:MAG: hypothetical protein ABIS45_08650, partial [Burkholderiales bacterium]